MTHAIKVAQKKDLDPGTGRVIEVQGIKLALFRVGENFYAIDNTCKHRGGPLGEGELADSTVTCPWHGWQYNVTSGACVTRSDVTVKKYEVKVEGEDILISLP